MDKFRESLTEALDSQFNKLESASDVEAQGKIARNIDILGTHFENIVKEEHDHEEKMERLKMEQNRYDDDILDHRDEMSLKQETLEEQKKSRKWGNWITIGTTAANLVLTCILTAGIFNFEKEGTFTSSLRNGVLGRIVKK